MTQRLRLIAVAAVLAVVAPPGQTVDAAQGRGGPPTPPQTLGPPIAAPSLIGWKDLETWTREVAGPANVEFGLGLQLSGKDGTVSAGFAVTRLKEAFNATPKYSVAVTLIPAFNPNRVRWTTASVVVTGADKKKTPIDMSGRITTYPPGPFGAGDGPLNAQISMTAEEFLVLADAVTATGDLLSVPVTFRADQIRALRALGQRAGLIGPNR
jgi:hypothetical protein